MKGSFLITSDSENVITEKGVRAFIMERLLNSPFNKGAVFNIDDKTIEVRLEGDEEQIKAFIRDLNSALVRLHGNPTITLTEFQKNNELEIPELMRSSQALMVGQLEKGINVQLRIINVQLRILESLENVLKSLEKLPKKIADSLKNK